ncbi:hypothetical protein JCM8208_002058 [Rhodotorula glutinis]
MEAAHLLTDHFSDYYLEPPSPRQLDELKALRADALKHPLKVGDSLIWQGPNLHPESLPPADYPRPTPLASPHEPRPLLSALLARNSPAGVGRGWSLRLLEGVQTGADQWAQVWRCEAVDGRGLEVGRVVLKLYHQALFPFPGPWSRSMPQHDSFHWWPARHAEARESRAYRELSLYQGRNVPLCYGFYEFTLPGAGEVVGVVLEDLADDSVPFTALIEDMSTTFEQIAELARSAFELQHRVHEAGILHAACSELSLHRLRASWSAVVALGFSNCSLLDTALQLHAQHVARDRRDDLYPPHPSDDLFCGQWSDRSMLKNAVHSLLRDEEGA